MTVFKKIILLIVICVMFMLLNQTIVKNSYLDTTMCSSYHKKAEAAEAIEENKAIIVGGSGSNLGFDSEYLSEKMEMPVVNMAISAGVPLAVYLKMVELYANPGDSAFVVLENTYWQGQFWLINESYADMICVAKELETYKNSYQRIKVGYIEFFRSFSRLNDNINFAFQEIIDGGSIYVADSVNEYGDFRLHEGKKQEYKRKTSVASKFEMNEEVAKEITAFIERMKERNIKIYLSYPPQDGNRYENADEFFRELQTTVEQQFGKENVIGTPFDFIYDEDCFYDTEYHLQYEKRKMFTEDFYKQYSKMKK